MPKAAREVKDESGFVCAFIHINPDSSNQSGQDSTMAEVKHMNSKQAAYHQLSMILGLGLGLG